MGLFGLTIDRRTPAKKEQDLLEEKVGEVVIDMLDKGPSKDRLERIKGELSKYCKDNINEPMNQVYVSMVAVALNGENINGYLDHLADWLDDNDQILPHVVPEAIPELVASVFKDYTYG